MDRRDFLKYLGAGVATTALSVGEGFAAGDIEDMTARAVGCYGNKIVKTPNMDKFATQGVRFSRCYCQAPMCNPSRSSFMTGLRCDTTGVYSNADPMSDKLPAHAITLPELLKQKGIYSINIGKIFHHTWTSAKQTSAYDRLEFIEKPAGYKGKSTGYPKHLQDQVNKLPKPKFRFSSDPAQEQELKQLLAKRNAIWRTAKKNSREYNRARSMFQQPQANVVGDSGLLEEQEHDGKKARMACHILKEMAGDGKQFFMSMGFSRPHTPLKCPRKYLDMYDFDDIPAPPAPPKNDRNVPDVAKRFGRNYDIFNSHYKHPVTTQAARKAIHAYYGCASFVDDQIGMILRTLEKQGLADNTIVIIFSDHGFQLGEHNLWSKYTLMEQTTQVPMMVRVPGVSVKGAVCNEIIELVDLVPTLCDLLNMPKPPKLESTSFTPLLSQPNRSWKKAAFTVGSLAGHVGRSVRTKRWRYAEWTSNKTGQKVYELYDLQNDPWEQNNLAQNDQAANTVAKMKNTLAAGWKGALP